VKYRVRLTADAAQDLKELYSFLVFKNPRRAAAQASAALRRAFDALSHFPFSARRAAEGENALLRELVIPFGSAGHVALFEIDDASTVTILAVRQQREGDYR
jgi:plasmid stabilization system protein ParE